MGADRRLSSLTSYRSLGDRTVLVNHASHEVHLLNEEGGDVLARLDRGEGGFTGDEEEFIEQLARIGVMEPGSAPRPGGAGPSVGAGDLHDELNDWAAHRTIPLHCQMELTYRCALRCEHCYLGHGGGDGRAELTTAEIVRVLDELASLGCLFLLLTGGEPFLRRDFEDVFAAARDRRFAVSFITSGHAHDPRLLSRLARRGIDAAQVSLYGPDAVAHDAMTGVAGAFDDALACMRTLRDLGVMVRAAVTPTARTAHRIGEVRDLLEREGIPAALGLYMSPRRDGSRGPQALTIDAADLRRVLSVFPFGAAPRFAGLRLTDRPCGAGACAVSIDPYGTVHPCLQLRIGAGSLRERGIGEIWAGSPELRRLRDIRIADLVGCPECEIRDWCNRCAGFAHAEGMLVLNHCSFDCLQSRVLKEISGCFNERGK